MPITKPPGDAPSTSPLESVGNVASPANPEPPVARHRPVAQCVRNISEYYNETGYVLGLRGVNVYSAASRTVHGKTASCCAGCARKRRVYGATYRRKKWPDSLPLFAPPTDEARHQGRGAKRTGPTAPITFKLNQPTIDAISALKRRYVERNNGKRWRDHLGVILRSAVAEVFKKGGPIPEGRERICMRGLYCTVRFPVAQYQQITHLANEKFDGSRAQTVRVAIRQAVNPPFVIKTGGKRVLGGKPHDPWDDD